MSRKSEITGRPPGSREISLSRSCLVIIPSCVEGGGIGRRSALRGERAARCKRGASAPPLDASATFRCLAVYRGRAGPWGSAHLTGGYEDDRPGLPGVLE